ncbi:hypothetical protein [Pseudomonas defluvii]|uniref:hypothetical protein n=1 Tax=Pseudomonas defluvii TaxID=1876757 RepID=UPI00390601EC
MLVARIKFFKENGLLNVDIFDECGSFVDRCYYRNDFTWEGEALRKKKLGAWMNSKASKKIPPDMRILEAALAEIRAAK